MKKLLITITILFIICFSMFAQAEIETKENQINVVASTTWVASYAQIAGLKNVECVAPGTMIHPPEYEIKVSDIQKIMKADYFIYAGYEAMMKTISENVSPESTVQIQIDTFNSYENIASQARKIAKIANTETQCEENLRKLKTLLDESKEKLESQGINEVPCYCHFHQQYLAKDLGLNVLDIFGPSPLDSNQIQLVSKNKYPLIIDNVHNPIANVLLDVSKDSKIVVWRNFPVEVEDNSLFNLIKNNIDTLL